MITERNEEGSKVSRIEILADEDDEPRLKISISVQRELLERVDVYRKRSGGMNRSALFGLAVAWFMEQHPIGK